MIWLMLVPVWCIALLGLVALCRAGHLEDVEPSSIDDLLPVRVPTIPAQRQEALPLDR